MAIETMTEAQRIQAVNSKNNRTPTSNLGKDDFLQLLTTQLKNQDPMNPMEDMDFIGQMAEFSSLEQMLNLNTSVEKINTAINNNATTQAMMFLGTNVTAEVDDSDEPITGTVSTIGFKDNQPYLKVGEYAVALDQVKLVNY
jgi:flagellar basal-body rod modification protein FlgD